MIAQHVQQDTPHDDTESVSREQYEEMRRIADALLFWIQKVNREGRSALNDARYLRDIGKAEALGLTGDRK